MSEVQDRTALLAEQGLLRARLQSLPAAAALTRRSMEARAQMLDDALAALPHAAREPARARLTFDGRPVVGTHGVLADFGAAAVARFTEAVAAAAASVSAPLAAMGPIPGRERHQLLITGTAVGSFGFELEEAGNGELPLDEPTPVATALERTQRLMRDAAEADDDRLADTAAELDPRALAKVREFMGWLADNDAVCSLEMGDARFRFTDAGQVRRSVERLSADNLHEREASLEGVFEGVLPTRRTFEFRVGDDVLIGRFGPAIADPHGINRMLNRPLRFQVLITQVGAGRPRYTLLKAPEPIAGDIAGPEPLVAE
jgi:hypothetical protein